MIVIEQYIKDRVEKQINWFNSKAKTCKWHYYIFSMTSIVASALTPVFVKACPDTSIVTSLIATIVLSLNNLCKFKDKWNLYRMTAELLQKEKMLYLYSTDNPENKDNNFIGQIENILADSNKKWDSNIHQKGSNKKTDGM